MRDAVTPSLPVSDRDLERVLAGEAPAELVARVTALEASHPALAAHLRERRAEQAAFRLQHPRMPALALEPASGPRRFFAQLFRVPAISGALAAACALAFLVVRTDDREGSDVVRAKGVAPVVDVVAKRGARVFAVGPGALLRAGDALRVAVTCGAPSHVVVAIHEDDTGATSVLVDDEPVGAARALLEGSFVLDEHLGAESLWVVCAPDRGFAARVQAAMTKGELPAGAAVLPLRKAP